MIGFIQIGDSVFNVARIDRINDDLGGCTLFIGEDRYAVTETREQVIEKIRSAERGEAVPVLHRRPKPDPTAFTVP